MRFSVLVDIQLREGIADPAGSTIERVHPVLGYEGISDVSVGKTIRFEIEAVEAASARVMVGDLTDSFLTNPVIERAQLSVELSTSGSSS